MRSEGEKLVLLEAAQKARLEKESQSEKAEESAQQEATALPRSRRPRGPSPWVAQVLAAGKEWGPTPEEETCRRHRAFLTRINHNTRCGTPPRLKRLSPHCHKCREVSPSDRDGKDTSKFCALCGVKWEKQREGDDSRPVFKRPDVKPDSGKSDSGSYNESRESESPR